MSAVLEGAVRPDATPRAANGPLRVALVSINYAPELTGIAVYTTGLAEYLARSGMQVTVHTGFPYYPAWSKQPADRGRVFRRETINGVRVRRNWLYVPARPTALRRMLHEASFAFTTCLSYLFAPRADCTVIVSPPLPVGVPLALLARLKGSRCVFHVQDLQPDAALDLGLLRPGAVTRLLFLVEKLTYRLVDRVSTISEGMRRRILAKGVAPEKLLLFRNWADDERVTPMPGATAFRKDWELGERIVVLYAGNLGVKQAIGSLLDAAALLRSDPRIVFVVVGDGGEKTGLEARARQEGLHNVMFRPLQPLDRLSELLATADVAVIPQKRGVTDIVLPSKLCNILSSACPVVTAAPAGSELAEIVRAAECGIVVEPENAPQLAAAIARFAEAPALRTRCGCSGRRYMEVHLGHTPILERFRGDLLALARRAPSDQPRTAAR